MASVKDYEAEAKKIYDGQYASKIQTIKNQQTAQNQTYANDELNYKNLYDNYVKENRINGQVNQNTYNNNTLARGLGRSSIATTGLAGIKLATDKQEGTYNTERATKLQQLLAEKNNYNQGVNDNLNSIDTEKIGAISEYARKLYEAYLDRQLSYAQLNARSSSSSSGGSSSDTTEYSYPGKETALLQVDADLKAGNFAKVYGMLNDPTTKADLTDKYGKTFMTQVNNKYLAKGGTSFNNSFNVNRYVRQSTKY